MISLMCGRRGSRGRREKSKTTLLHEISGHGVCDAYRQKGGKTAAWKAIRHLTLAFSIHGRAVGATEHEFRARLLPSTPHPTTTTCLPAHPPVLRRWDAYPHRAARRCRLARRAHKRTPPHLPATAYRSLSPSLPINPGSCVGDGRPGLRCGGALSFMFRREEVNLVPFMWRRAI